MFRFSMDFHDRTAWPIRYSHGASAASPDL
jgi:hypothetical protein